MTDSTADRAREPRVAWGPLLAAALVVPTVLAGLTQLWPRPQIEDRLTRTGGDALAAAGFTGADLRFSGRDATIAGIAAADGPRAVETVEGVTGVRVARVAGGAAAAPAPAAAAAPFGLVRRGEDVVLTGVVGSAEERTRLVAAATEGAAGRSVIDELTVAAGTGPPAGVDATSVGAAAAALAGSGADTALRIADAGVTLTGTVTDDAARAAAEQAVTAALPGLDVDNRLVVDPAAGPAGPVELDTAGKQQLRSSLDQVVAGAPITFEPNSPALTGPGRETVGRVLELVRTVPGARFQLDGFVATGPGAGVLSAQELSDQRAAAVRDLLAAGGVPVDRIAVRGLGEGPEPAARSAGRRVEITVV